SQINSYEISIFNVLGEAVIRTSLTSSATTISTSTLTTGMYFYKIIDKTGNTIQSGRMISQQ
ncbi:MAG: T9SS type A sorting domain-containing protein, partial [Bacteroidia bacterium]